MMEPFIVVGKIGAPHGVRGEVRVQPLTDFPGRFNGLKSAFLDEKTELEIERVKYNNQLIILKFKNFDDRNDIEPLKGKLLKVNRKDISPLAPGEYYHFDIVGLEVYNENEEHLGKIVEILKTGSNDVYVVNNAEQQLLIPALKKVVTKIDIAAGRMNVLLQEELE